MQAPDKTHSPTFGGRQTSKDTVDGTSQKRIDHDVANPRLGFYRDVKTMLERTNNQHYDTTFDMTQRSTQLSQHGAYRKLFKSSAQMNAKDATRGFDPNGAGYDIAHTESKKGKIGSFSSTKDGTTTIGAKISSHLMSKL